MIKYNKSYYYFSYWLCLFTFLCFENCKHPQKNNHSTSKNIYNNIQKKTNLPVIITGTTDDPKAFKYFNLIGLRYLKIANSKDSLLANNNHLYIKSASLKQPQLINLLAFGKTLFNTTIFMSPGDSIFLKIKNKKIKFEGKNAAHYNFFIDLDLLKLKWPIYSGNIEKYKQDCQSIFNKRKTFFNQYLKQNPEVSNDFKTIVRGRLQFEYLSKLINVKTRKGNVILTKKFADEIKNTDKGFNRDKYFDNITIEQFNKPKLLNEAYFYNTLLQYIQYYFLSDTYKIYSKEKFIEEQKFILNNLKDDIQRFAIFRLITDYFVNNPSENSKNIKVLISSYKNNFKTTVEIEKLKKIEKELNILNKPFSTEVLNSKLLNLKGDTILVKDILKRTKNNIKVIDFWASWCGPCVNEIMIGDTQRKKLSKKNSIAWLYFSIDINKEEWIKKSKQLAKYGLLKNQYHVLNPQKSALINFLNVKSIPRYIVLDKENLIVNENAARPSNKIEFQKIIDKIKLGN